MLRGAILFFVMLFIAFIIYKAFPTVNGYKQGPLATPTVNETTEQEKEDQQDQVEVTSTVSSGAAAPAQETTDAANSARQVEGFAPNCLTMECPDFATPPGKLPTALAGDVSDNAPRLSYDPALEPTTTARILQGLDALRGFLNYEAPSLEERSDPQIQLPLSTLKADAQTLTSEALVLARNPGLRSTITQQQMDAIEANLDYLQKAHRRFENA